MPNLDIEYIVDKLASFNLIRTYRISGEYYQCYCPIHSEGQERRPSFGILLHDQYRNGSYYPAGWSHCFTCGEAWTLPELISKILESKNISKSGMDWLKENIPDFEYDEDIGDSIIPNSMFERFNENNAINYMKKISCSTVKYVSEEELASYRYTVPYMYERGLTDAIIEKYDIGVDMNYIPYGRKKKVPCITFPVRDVFGNTLFVARRSIQGKSFYLPQGVDKPLYGIYELPNNCKSADVVESIFNLTTAVKYGRPAIALLGTGTHSQIEQLRRSGIQEFRLGLDPDDAGSKGTARLKKGLSDVAVVWQYSGIPEGKDINDLTEEEFDTLRLV